MNTVPLGIVYTRWSLRHAAALRFRNTAQYIEREEHIDKNAIGIAPGRRVGHEQLQGIRHLFLGPAAATLLLVWLAILVFLWWNGMQYQTSPASDGCHLLHK